MRRKLLVIRDLLLRRFLSVQKIEDHDQKQIFILNFTVVGEF